MAGKRTLELSSNISSYADKVTSSQHVNLAHAKIYLHGKMFANLFFTRLWVSLATVCVSTGSDPND